MNYKYTELEYAKTIYEHGFQSEQHIPTELRLVATYMRRNLDYKPKKLREALYHWCETHMNSYKRELHYKMIQYAINKACQKGSMLVNIENIAFYQYEMDYIDGLHISGEYSHECKKLLFTLLFVMKINKAVTEFKSLLDDYKYQGKYFKGGKRKYSELKKLAKLPEKVKIHEDIIHDLWVNNLVTPMCNGLIRLDFMDDIYHLQSQATDSEQIVALQIKDYDSVGWYFDYYHKDKKIIFCKCCGKIFKKRSNKEIYCSEECKKFMKNEMNKNYTKNKQPI